jgi:hypothetical protein
VLAAQFESFKDPLIIMFSVPLAVAGALIFMSLSGVTMNIFSEIGIIMLIGLVAKNGILIVEFANQRQDAGFTKREAILGASVQRLRPILMTSLATILGLLPLVFAQGEGANGRIAMGIAVGGGMLISTFLTLFVVPLCIYICPLPGRQVILRKEVPMLNPQNPCLINPLFRRTVAWLILLLFSVGSRAGEPMSLRACLLTGLQNNYDLRISRNEEQISNNNLSWGNAGYLPSVSLNSGYTFNQKHTDQFPAGGGAKQSIQGAVTQLQDVGVALDWTF